MLFDNAMILSAHQGLNVPGELLPLFLANCRRVQGRYLLAVHLHFDDQLIFDLLTIDSRSLIQALGVDLRLVHSTELFLNLFP